MKYSFDSDRLGPPHVQDALARNIIKSLPYILFFDDFRDKIEERVEIVSGDGRNTAGWLSIVEQLFNQTNNTFSVFQLPTLEERQRKTVLSKVQRRLNETLTKEWQSFRLDDRDALKICIDFYREEVVQVAKTAPQPPTQPAVPSPPRPLVQPAPSTQPQASVQKIVRNYIKFEVVETDSAGDEHFFFISDRSKGFYWFFNFVMKLEFNPKVVGDNAHTVYLLDEPGSYLHAVAQRKLCQKLRNLSRSNRVIYCTHSHYLLDPEVIPVSSITVADKDGNGNVTLTPIPNYRGASDNRSALQPVLDALQIRPFALDLISTRATVITEGIYDYFAMELFRNSRPISVLPSVGADSIKFYVSLLIAWQVEFRVLWDNDEEGRSRHAQALDLFGAEIAARTFRLLSTVPGRQRRIMQDLFDGTDIVMVRTELDLPHDSSFEQMLHALFYSPRRGELVQAMGQYTKRNFEQLFDALSLG